MTPKKSMLVYTHWETWLALLAAGLCAGLGAYLGGVHFGRSGIGAAIGGAVGGYVLHAITRYVGHRYHSASA